MEPKVSIIILNWNGELDTIECLESLYQINYSNYNVILVDNQSKKDSIDIIEKYCKGKIKVESFLFQFEEKNKPIKIVESKNFEKVKSNYNPLNNRITIIKNDINYGFAEGNNIGIKYALREFCPEYILLLNNDTIVDKNFLKELIKKGESKKNIGVLGPKTYFYDYKSRHDVISIAGGELNPYKCKAFQIGSLEVDTGQYDSPKEVNYVEGSCFLIKKELFDHVGFLDAQYFAYWEDIDFCIRSSKYGYKSFYVPRSRIWHKVGSSRTNRTNLYLTNRNMFFFMKKNAKFDKYLIFLLYFFTCRFIMILISYSVYNQDFPMIKVFLKSIYDGLNTDISKNLKE